MVPRTALARQMGPTPTLSPDELAELFSKLANMSPEMRKEAMDALPPEERACLADYNRRVRSAAPQLDLAQPLAHHPPGAYFLSRPAAARLPPAAASDGWVRRTRQAITELRSGDGCMCDRPPSPFLFTSLLEM